MRRKLTPAEVRSYAATMVRVDAQIAYSMGDIEGAANLRDLARGIDRMRLTIDATPSTGGAGQ